MEKSVVCVGLAREHLPFFRHWCEWHLQQGFRIHFYDNTGSQGSTRRTSSFAKKQWAKSQVDKRRRPYGIFTAGLSDDEVSARLRESVADLDGVVIEEWQPRDRSGRIVHGQVEAYADFIRRFRGEVEWGAFMDADEYLEVRGAWGWGDLLSSCGDLGRVRILGDSWECRWTEEGEPRGMEALRFVESQGVGGVKNIVRLADVEWADLHSYWGLRGAVECYEALPGDFGFRHYANPGRAGGRCEEWRLKGGAAGLGLWRVKVPGRNGESVRV